MVQTFLITGGTKEERIAYVQNECKTWNVKSFDQSILRNRDEVKDSIGIGDVRAWQKTLSLSPHASAYTVGIIPDAHALTLEAQHALLKTLEEPPMHVRIFLETDSVDTLLPTILSRCTTKIIGNRTYPPADKEKTFATLASLTSINHGAIAAMTDTHFGKKTDAMKTLEDFLHTFHTLLTQQDAKKSIGWENVYIEKGIRAILKAQNQLAANVNHRLVMDELLFTFLALQSSK